MVVVETIYHNHLLPPQQWELDLAAKGDLTLSMLRFAIAFFTSIPVAIIFRRIPTPKGDFRHFCLPLLILIKSPPISHLLFSPSPFQLDTSTH